MCWLSHLSESENNAPGIQTIIPKSQYSCDSNHSAEGRHKPSQQQPQLHGITELPAVPRQLQKSQAFTFYARENLKPSILQVSMLSVTCSSGEHVDRGTRWASRSRWNSLRNFRKSRWRWWRRLTLQGEQENPTTSLTESFKPSVCLSSFPHLFQST